MKIYLYILVMAVTTYLVRAIPLILMKKPKHWLKHSM